MTVCTGHSLLREMTLISLLPNLAESISPAIRGEGGEGGGGEGRREGGGKEGKERMESRG